jgi:hypothetical protein
MPKPNHIPYLPNFHLMPACSRCSAQMKMVCVTRTDEGLEDRTFECPKCHHVDMLVFETADDGRDPAR